MTYSTKKEMSLAQEEVALRRAELELRAAEVEVGEREKALKGPDATDRLLSAGSKFAKGTGKVLSDVIRYAATTQKKSSRRSRFKNLDEEFDTRSEMH